ncbi:serine hydrolase [Trichocoleus sp. FACHB-591]|uniref:serine hydrolase n=1 Tax=Trichocoleus sp. FACHB-591 TaxID=2692872 RepID=UPI0016861B90|nr:serine hydrolase [Trichocoleus sp. FACHB-591]MBD2093971.1 serine hydrolase [Trichocoleus sp. FACHB-591]
MQTVAKFPWFVPGLVGTLLLSAPAHADVLQSWRFDARQNQLEISTDEGVQPTAQLIANPSRVVIDLPGIRLGRPKTSQVIGGTVQAVRTGQFNAQTARFVVELAPGYTVDPQQVQVRGSSLTRWTVKLPTPQPTTAIIANPPSNVPQAIATVAPPPDTFGGLIPAGRPLTWLQQRVSSLRTSKYSSLRSGISFLDMETGNYLDLNGDKVYATASIIKLPILIAFFQDVDAGKIKLNETLTMTRDMVVGGSGEMQDLPVGSKFTALETATKMITISDNTATNMIIKRMGGIQMLNQRFRSWGLEKTVIRNWLPDLRGTNTTTAKELTRLLAMLDQQKLLSSKSQAQAIGILQRVKNRKLLPVGLGRGATIAHKTGDIGFLLGDAGIVVMPNGKHYLAAVLVESAYDDPAARDFIQDVSRIVYSYLDQAPRTASVNQPNP